VIDELKEANFTHLKITGGEPFIRKDLIEILEYILNKGLYVDVSTNASLIDEAKALRLKEIGMPLVHVSLDGHNVELHEKVRGKGTFLATSKGIEKLVRNQLYVRIGSLLYKDNQDQMEAMVKHCIFLGVNEVVFSRMEAVGRMKGDDSLVTYKKNEVFKEELERLTKLYGQKIKINGSFSEVKKETGCASCPGGEKFLYIDYQGKLSPCTWITQYFNHYSPQKTLHEEGFSNLLKSSEIKSYLTLTKSLYQSGLNGCPAQMHEQVKTYESISNLFKNDLKEELEKEGKFSKISALYSFTTENIAGYFPKFNFSGKTILSVGGSGDHLINANFLGAKKVICFDSNLLTEFYVELKLAALQTLSLEDFKNFLMRDKNENKKSFSYETYLKLKSQLSLLAQHFFSQAYDYFGKNGWKLRESKLFNNQYDSAESKVSYNLYLMDEINYKKAQKAMKGKKLEWASEYLQFIHKNKKLTAQKFDLILLSNISDYAHKMYKGEDYLEQFKEKIIVPLLSQLTTGGELLMGYIYNDSLNHNQRSYRTKIDQLEIREKIFSLESFNYRELSFPGVIEGNDLILTLNKKEA